MKKIQVSENFLTQYDINARAIGEPVLVQEVYQIIEIIAKAQKKQIYSIVDYCVLYLIIASIQALYRKSDSVGFIPKKVRFLSCGLAVILCLLIKKPIVGFEKDAKIYIINAWLLYFNWEEAGVKKEDVITLIEQAYKEYNV